MLGGVSREVRACVAGAERLGCDNSGAFAPVAKDEEEDDDGRMPLREIIPHSPTWRNHESKPPRRRHGEYRTSDSMA